MAHDLPHPRGLHRRLAEDREDVGVLAQRVGPVVDEVAERLVGAHRGPDLVEALGADARLDDPHRRLALRCADVVEVEPGRHPVKERVDPPAAVRAVEGLLRVAALIGLIERVQEGLRGSDDRGGGDPAGVVGEDVARRLPSVVMP